MSAPAEGGFRPRGRVAAPVHRVDRDACLPAFRRFLAADGFEALVAEQVVERAVAIGRAREPMEWMGLLVGRACEDRRGRYALVLGMVLDRGAVAGPHAIRSTPESEAATRQLARDLFPDCAILGWIHGHIRHGVTYSGVDRANQRTWQQPDAVGIVVDPWSRDLLGAYRGPTSERLRALDPLPASFAGPPTALVPEAAPRRMAPRRRAWWTWRHLTCAALVAVAALAAGAVGRLRAVHGRLVALERSHAEQDRSLRAIARALPVPAAPPGETCRGAAVCRAPTRGRAEFCAAPPQRRASPRHGAGGGTGDRDGRGTAAPPVQGNRP